jgi:hypothetical protein
VRPRSELSVPVPRDVTESELRADGHDGPGSAEREIVGLSPILGLAESRGRHAETEETRIGAGEEGLDRGVVEEVVMNHFLDLGIGDVAPAADYGQHGPHTGIGDALEQCA